MEILPYLLPVTNLGGSMEVKVDQSLCIGAGQCAAFAEGVFEQNENGIACAVQSQVNQTRIDEIRLAVQLCPVTAISLVGADEE